LAGRSGEWVTRGRIAAIAYIAIIFYALPFAAIWATRDMKILTAYEPTVPSAVEKLRNEEAENLNGVEQNQNGEPATNLSN
jgi:hypothetical protein